ncbi:MAG: VWA domain-containing protein, partial [Chloroflexota bacterium]
MTFDIRQDRSYLRAPSRSTRYLVIRLTAPEARQRPGRLPVNVGLILDRSGSMGGPKIRLAKEAAERAVATLDAHDRFSVVFYDDTIDVVVPSTAATASARAAASEALRRVDARGSTNLFGGWMRGCEQVALHSGGEVVSRALLLTDGLANVGVTDRFELETHAAELRRRGVSTSTFGVGHDFDEALLEAIATAGGGNFYYIEDARQIGDFMTSELGEALEVVARDVRLEVTVPFGAQ